MMENTGSDLYILSAMPRLFFQAAGPLVSPRSRGLALQDTDVTV